MFNFRSLKPDTMMKKLLRCLKTVGLILMPFILVCTLINMSILTQTARSSKSHQTPFVFQERFLQARDGSSSDLNTGSDKTHPKQRNWVGANGEGGVPGANNVKNNGKVVEEVNINTRDSVNNGNAGIDNIDAKGNGVVNRNAAEDSETDRGSEFKDQTSKAEGTDNVEGVESESENGRPVFKDDEVDAMIEKLRSTTIRPFFPWNYWNSTIGELTKSLGALLRKSAKTLVGYKSIVTKKYPILPAWKRVHRNIRQYSLYDPEDPNLNRLLKDLSTVPIKSAEENDGGTQLKINVAFHDGGRAVLKPMRYPREVEADENRYIFDDIERHVAEIAAFNLDRALGFYRVPPTIGRWINITSELLPILPKAISKTVFTSPAGNICFYGECDYYCDSAHAFCGHPDMIEASMMSYLPSRNIARRNSWYQPWRRSYSKSRKAYWELHDDLCDNIRNDAPFNNKKLLLDMIDAHTFDFLGGNKDRHSFATFSEWGNFTFPILYDNGRAFGRQTYDAMSILAPLKQCCMIRKSTFLKYVKLYTGPEHLSGVMETALQSDPIAPVLIEGHLQALDRRLVKILQAVAKCIKTKPVDRVVINDAY